MARGGRHRGGWGGSLGAPKIAPQDASGDAGMHDAGGWSEEIADLVKGHGDLGIMMSGPVKPRHVPVDEGHASRARPDSSRNAQVAADHNVPRDIDNFGRFAEE